MLRIDAHVAPAKRVTGVSIMGLAKEASKGDTHGRSEGQVQWQ